MTEIRSIRLAASAGADHIHEFSRDTAGNRMDSYWADDTLNAARGAGDMMTIDALDGDDRITLQGSANPAYRIDDLTILAGRGADTIYAALGFEAREGLIDIRGGAGDDEIRFQGGAELRIDGGAGDDTLRVNLFHSDDQFPHYPDPVTALLTGGDGRDSFDLQSWDFDKPVIITDFTPGEDSLLLRGPYYFNNQPREITPASLLTDPDLSVDERPEGLVIHFAAEGFDGVLRSNLHVTLAGVTLDRFMAGTVNVIGGTDSADRMHEDYVDASGHGFGAGFDLVLGGAGNDNIRLSGFGDWARGGAGRDVITARGGGHRVDGDAGDDQLIARQGGSTLDGDSGNDRLVADMAGGGDHLLIGGDGADRFEFTGGGSARAADVEIADFVPGVDRLIVEGAEIDLPALPEGMLLGAAADGSVILSVGLNDTLTLRGVTLDDLAPFG